MSETAIVAQDKSLQELQQKLGELKAKAEMQVTDQDTFIKAAAVKLDLEAYIRAVNDHFEPELAPAEETVKRVKLAIAGLVTQPKQWLADLIARRNAYAEQKRQEAEQEQERINEAARKAARNGHTKTPPPVQVKASIPTVAGTRNVRKWRYRVVNLALIPDEFWMLDEKKLAEQVRREKQATNIPGIEVYPE